MNTRAYTHARRSPSSNITHFFLLGHTSLAVVLTILFVLIAMGVIAGGYFLYFRGKQQYEQINQ